MNKISCLRLRLYGIASLAIAAAGLSLPAGAVYIQTNLVSDITGLAAITDASLKNPWGLSHTPTSPFWVSDQGTNRATLYNVTAAGVVTKNPLEVTMPTTASGPQGPTGQLFNPTTSFQLTNNTVPNFIFANLNGSIAAWNNGIGTAAELKVTTPGAVYTGLAIGTSAAGPTLYAANGPGNRIDVFNGTYAPVTLAGTFATPAAITAMGLAPFNVQNIGNSIYVTYAPAGGRPTQIHVPEGTGAVAEFDVNGNLIRTIIGSKLASPWGIVRAPAAFGPFSGDLLVGNFSFDASEINAFDFVTGALLGTIPIDVGPGNTAGGLWGLILGNSGNNGSPNNVYFADGINGEVNGLFASLAFVPEPASIALLGLGLFGLGFIRRRT